MTFNRAIEACWARFADPRGHARRSEFWWFLLFAALMNFAAPALLKPSGARVTVAFAAFAAFAVTVPPLVAVAVRRLHDVEFAGWRLLLLPVPMGVIVVSILLAWPGSDGPNLYGKRPVGETFLQPGAGPIPRIHRR